ncbi:MAG TPA: GatB/YqeY domain-containing protein [Xanthobacteraceae bacterium]
MLRDEINTALKNAMKARDQRRVSTLRLVNAAIKNADIEAETGKKAALSDADLLPLLQKLIKQRQEAAEIYDKAGRDELAGQERGEIEIIRTFLPRQMSDAEAKAAIADAIKATGATGIKDMGKVMAALKQAHAGQMDFGKAGGLVKALLTAPAG